VLLDFGQLQHVGQEHWRPAERSRRYLGYVLGRLQPFDHECERHDGLRPHHAFGLHPRQPGEGGLRPAPRALSVLCFDGEPDARASHFDGDDRFAGCSQPPVRHSGLQRLPAVSILKAPGFQDAHAGYSDPLDEQTFVVNTINSIEASPFWSSTAIIIAYDDSDGWYDHLTDFVNGSATAADSLNGTGVCISATAAAAALPGPNSNGKPVQGRCGHGPRLPLLVISPWSKVNYIDNTPTDQASITRFIEDTFLASARIGGGSFDATAGTLNNMFNFSNNVVPNPNIVTLNPSTGVVVSSVAP
jgi:hypothetical protein